MYSVKEFFRDASKTTLFVVVGGLLAALLLILFGFVGVYGNGWFTDHTANRSGKTQVKHQINGNGSYRIAAYDHFFDLCATVQTDKQVLTNTQNQLKMTTDEGTKLTLNADVLAQQNKLDTDVNQYNQDARKSATAGQFRASDLPSTLDTMGVTTCTAN